MKKNKKLVALSIVACALSLTGAMLCVSSPKTVGATSEGLTMTPGASVRLTTKDDKSPVNGLRFEAQMTKDYYDELQGTEVVLSSTAKANGAEHSVEWVLNSATKEELTPSFSDGVAKFHHTLTFDSLFNQQEQLRQANAFDFETSFTLEVDGEEVWTDSQTRSMRQVAYKAYNTASTVEKPNAGYQNPTLLNYFTASDAENAKVYSVGETDETTVGNAVNSKAYAELDGMFIDVSSTAMKDLKAKNVNDVVVFDENNVASKTPIKWPDQMISTPDELSALLTNGTTQVGEYYVLKNNIYIPQLNNIESTLKFQGILDGNGYTVYAPQRKYGLFGNIENGAVKNMKLVVDMSNVTGLKGSGNEANVLSIKVYKATLENLYVKMIGNGAGIQSYGFGLFGFDHTNSPSTFKNLVVDYADMLPAQPTAIANVKYNSLFGMYAINGTAENIHFISTTTNWMSNTGSKTVETCDYATLHSDIATIPADKLNSKYWDTTSGTPVWKTDEVVDNNQIVWSANTSKAHIFDVLPEGEAVKTITDVLGTTYYENGEWKNTSAFPANVGYSSDVKFYKTVKVVGVNGTEVTTIMNGYNEAMEKADALEAIIPEVTVAGKYIMANNITVDTWTNNSGTQFKGHFAGTFDGNGYTLTCPNRQFGIFATMDATATVKNLHLKVTLTGAYDLTSSVSGQILAYTMDGTLENLYIELEGTVDDGTYSNPDGMDLYNGSAVNEGTNVATTATMKNVVVNYGEVYKDYKIDSSLDKYGLLWVNNTVANCQGVYVITSLVALSGGHSGLNYSDVYYAENNAVEGAIVANGVRRYNQLADIATDKNANLTGFNANYWDTTSGAPVWKTK